jgi:lysophospholipase L1-like esterase
MNVKGERILIFGDSLTHHGADAGPETWIVNAGSSRSSSAPGDLLASLLLEQGAAVRTDARVGRSAANFYEREDAQGLLNANKAWKPTKVVIMLGTNDLGRDVGKTTTAMAALKQAFELGGAEVWAIGPMSYNNASLNAQAPQVVQLMRNVFGARFIDARGLSVQTDRAKDGVHFGPGAARQTALNLANALMGAGGGSGDALGAVLLGGALALGAVLLFNAFKNPAPTRREMFAGPLMLGAPMLAGNDDDEDDATDFGEETWFERIRRRDHERRARITKAMAKSPAVILTDGSGRETLVVITGEMQNTDEGKHRATYLAADGPVGHVTRKTLDKVIEEIDRDYRPASVRAATDEEVMAWTSTPEYEEGARRVAEVQRANAGLKGPPELRVGQQFSYFGNTYEIIKIFRNKERTVQIARRSRDSFGKELLIDHRSFPARDFDRQHLTPLQGLQGAKKRMRARKLAARDWGWVRDAQAGDDHAAERLAEALGFRHEATARVIEIRENDAVIAIDYDGSELERLRVT